MSGGSCEQNFVMWAWQLHWLGASL